jgi:ribosomal protein S18 acetylase RimI-like enzyme
MQFRLTTVTLEDVPALVALHNSVSAHLTSQFGQGPWSSQVTERGILFGMRTSVIYIARSSQQIIATLRLQTRKPWAIDKKYFSPASQKPLYLTGMAVHPFEQRKGVGRRCLEEAQRLARLWPADALRLDAWDADAGAGDFYRKCGFQEVGRASYRGNPHIYFELLLP